MKSSVLRAAAAFFAALAVPTSAKTNDIDVATGSDADSSLNAETVVGRAVPGSTVLVAPAAKTPGIVRFALCQTPADAFPPKDRIDAIFEWTRTRLPGDEDVIVFPEFAFTSFSDEAEAWRDATSVWARATAFARERRAFVVVNHPSGSGGEPPRVYGETRVFSPTGTVAAVYRKRNLAAMDRAAGLSAGDRSVVAELPFARLGLLICKDAFFPEDGIEIGDYAAADVLVVQFSHPGVDDRNAPEAADFSSVEEERKRMRSTWREWEDLRKPYFGVNRAGPDGNYRLAGGTFATAASGRIVAGLDADPGILVVDCKVLPDGRLVPDPVVPPRPFSARDSLED